MSELTLSTLGLILLGVPFLVHGIEALWPLQARWVVNWVLPFFAPALPDRARALMATEQTAMLDVALHAAPHDKQRAGEDYVFLLMIVQRKGAVCFAAITVGAVGAIYGLTSGLADRDALHVVFTPFRATAAVLNGSGVSYALSPAVAE